MRFFAEIVMAFVPVAILFIVCAVLVLVFGAKPPVR